MRVPYVQGAQLVSSNATNGSTAVAITWFNPDPPNVDHFEIWVKRASYSSENPYLAVSCQDSPATFAVTADKDTAVVAYIRTVAKSGLGTDLGSSPTVTFNVYQQVIIPDNTITTNMIQDAAIVNAKIANLAVNNAKINDLAAIKITAGTFVAGVIYANAINASQINAGTITVTNDTTNIFSLSAATNNYSGIAPTQFSLFDSSNNLRAALTQSDVHIANAAGTVRASLAIVGSNPELLMNGSTVITTDQFVGAGGINFTLNSSTLQFSVDTTNGIKLFDTAGSVYTKTTTAQYRVQDNGSSGVYAVLTKQQLEIEDVSNNRVDITPTSNSIFAGGSSAQAVVDLSGVASGGRIKLVSTAGVEGFTVDSDSGGYTSATGGTHAVPANAKGFLQVKIAGVNQKIPYFDV
jgi:hypothetical protein